MKNRLKELFSRQKQSLGTWVTIGHADVAEILAQMDFDWLVFDSEHSPLSMETVQEMIRATKSSKVTPLVRVAWNDPVLVKRALDIGAHGVVVPWVNTRKDAELAVKSSHYPPLGIRGTGPRRAANFDMETREYLATANDEVMTIVQVETSDSVKNLSEILSVEGVDCAFIGPSDLSASLGHLGHAEHRDVQEAIGKVLEEGRRLSKPIGIMALDVADAAKRMKEGFQFISVGSDYRLLIWACREAVKTIKRSGR